MPIFDYRCNQCGTQSELLLRSPDCDVICPTCGSTDMQKLVSASYTIKMDAAAAGTTCCGRGERCEKPPCSGGETCRRG